MYSSFDKLELLCISADKCLIPSATTWMFKVNSPGQRKQVCVNVYWCKATDVTHISRNSNRMSALSGTRALGKQQSLRPRCK